MLPSSFRVPGQFQKMSHRGRILQRGQGCGAWPVSVSLMVTRTTLLGRVGRISCRGWQGD